MAGNTSRSPGRIANGAAERVWVVPSVDEAAVDGLESAAGVSRLVARVCAARGMTDAAEVKRYVNPSIGGISEPWALSGMEAAAERLAKAVRDRQKVVIFGDYDVDGITATAIVKGALKRLGLAARVCIPDRMVEGYGPNPQAMKEIIASGADLVVTVDCGVKATAEAEMLREAGVDLVITDHHHAGETLPYAAAVVNPRLSPNFPTKEAAGVAVAFYLAWALGEKVFGKGDIKPQYRRFLTDAIELVALGTVADVAPLLGENRLLVGYGLRKMARSSIPGVRALIEVARIGNDDIGAMKVAFGIAPRINAAGRIGHAIQALELLTAEDDETAMTLARQLDAINRKRQRIEEEIFDGLLAELSEAAPEHGIVASREDWHAGVIGIVASRLCEKYNRPVALVSFNNGEMGRGSARSPQGFDLHAALAEVGGHFEKWGGHEYAAGFAIRREKYEPFRKAFEEVSGRMIRESPPRPTLQTDGVFQPDELTLENVADLSRLEPYGEGNPEPLGVLSRVTPSGPVRLMGAGEKHISFLARAGRRTFRTVGFGKTGLIGVIENGKPIDVAVRPTVNTFRGETSVELILEAARISQ